MLPRLCTSSAVCVNFQGQDQGGVVASGLQAVRLLSSSRILSDSSQEKEDPFMKPGCIKTTDLSKGPRSPSKMLHQTKPFPALEEVKPSRASL